MQTNQQAPLASLPNLGEAMEVFKKQIQAAYRLSESEEYTQAFGYLSGAGNALIKKTELSNHNAETPIWGYLAD